MPALLTSNSAAKTYKQPTPTARKHNKQARHQDSHAASGAGRQIPCELRLRLRSSLVRDGTVLAPWGLPATNTHTIAIHILAHTQRWRRRRCNRRNSHARTVAPNGPRTTRRADPTAPASIVRLRLQGCRWSTWPRSSQPPVRPLPLPACACARACVCACVCVSAPQRARWQCTTCGIRASPTPSSSTRARPPPSRTRTRHSSRVALEHPRGANCHPV
jgi:hypothetical protein